MYVPIIVGWAWAARCSTKRRITYAQRSDHAGIGFGLYADYGAAQRLYIKRGYIPDGRGAHYGTSPVFPRRDLST